MPPDDALPPFPGFRPEALQFLRGLKAHNDREWFRPRKGVYEDELLWPARCLVADVAARARAAGVALAGDPGKSVFRVCRDTRFSKDKAPYKTHVGLYLSPSGDKDDEGGLYVHVEPGASFFAAGFWSPDGPWLRRWRERLAADPAGWAATVAEVEAAGLAVGPGYVAPLKRLPRGYEALADSPVAPALRWKGAVATRPVADAALARPDLAADAVAFVQAAAPLLDRGRGLSGVP